MELVLGVKTRRDLLGNSETEGRSSWNKDLTWRSESLGTKQD